MFDLAFFFLDGVIDSVPMLFVGVGVAVGVAVGMSMFMMMRMAPEQMNVAASAPDLANKIKKSERNQRAAGQVGKRVANPAVDSHAAPHNQYSKRGGE